MDYPAHLLPVSIRNPDLATETTLLYFVGNNHHRILFLTVSGSLEKLTGVVMSVDHFLVLHISNHVLGNPSAVTLPMCELVV